jgi:hypothetical protein
MRGRHRLDEPVQLGRRDPPHPRLGHLVDRLEHLRRALAGQRRDVQDRRVVEELQLLPQLVVELLREVRPAPLHQVPLVHRDDDPAPGLVGGPGDGGVLVGGPLGGIDEQHRDVRLVDRPLRQHDADRLDLAAARHAPRPADAGRVDDAERPPVPLQDGVHGVPRRARHLADDRALLLQQPVEQRRLADVRPADDGDGGLLGVVGRQPLRRAGPGKRLTISSSRSPTPSPCSAAISTTGSKPSWKNSTNRPRARRRRSCSRRRARGARPPAGGGDLLVAGTSPSRPSTTNTTMSAVGQGALPLGDDQLVQRILAGAEHPPRIDEVERHPLPLGRLDDVPGRPGDGGDDGPAGVVMRLKRVDFPTLGRPTSTTVGPGPARLAGMSKVYLGPDLTA